MTKQSILNPWHICRRFGLMGECRQPTICADALCARHYEDAQRYEERQKMYTAENVRNAKEEHFQRDLDDKIIKATTQSKTKEASIRVTYDDPNKDRVQEELERRGFVRVVVSHESTSSIYVTFEWD